MKNQQDWENSNFYFLAKIFFKAKLLTLDVVERNPIV
jgi:hypothetical protein